jgi:hypothetical protein
MRPVARRAGGTKKPLRHGIAGRAEAIEATASHARSFPASLDRIKGRSSRTCPRLAMSVTPGAAPCQGMPRIVTPRSFGRAPRNRRPRCTPHPSGWAASLRERLAGSRAALVYFAHIRHTEPLGAPAQRCRDPAPRPARRYRGGGGCRRAGSHGELGARGRHAAAGCGLARRRRARHLRGAAVRRQRRGRAAARGPARRDARGGAAAGAPSTGPISPGCGREGATGPGRAPWQPRGRPGAGGRRSDRGQPLSASAAGG